MTKVTYFVEYWHTEPGRISPPKPFYQSFGSFTSKVEAVKAANSLPPERKARVKKYTHTVEVVWCAKTLRGDTRGKKK